MFTELKRKLWLKAGWSEAMKISEIWTFVRRWAPVLSVLLLTLKGFADAAGKKDTAGFLDLIMQVTGLSTADPMQVANTTAFAGSAFKFCKLLLGAVAAVEPTPPKP